MPSRAGQPYSNRHPEPILLSGYLEKFRLSTELQSTIKNAEQAYAPRSNDKKVASSDNTGGKLD
jgi:hypothetical protein